jgi:CRP-like cAMP-binding protein
MSGTVAWSESGTEGFDGRGISLLDAEPAFAAAVPADELEAAERMLRLPTIALDAGGWTPPDALGRALGLLVVDGIVLRERKTRAGAHLSLAGPGDLVDVRQLAGGPDEGWRVIRPAVVAVVDARVLMAARRWPQLVRVLTQLLFDSVDDQAALNHILGLTRIENRLLAFFAHYAERWGRVTRMGRAIDLPLTHEVLGRLVGAKRPTVTLALNNLAHEGRLVRDEQRRWVAPLNLEDAA